MANHELPPDVDRWPRNPWRLLGVEFSASREEIRRAYVRLIRKYKPDDHPEEFQRIRDAYEAALANVVENDAGRADPTEEVGGPSSGLETDSAAESVPGERAPNDEHAFSTEPYSPASHREPIGARLTAEDEARRIWRQAVDGDSAGAQVAIAELAERVADHEELALRHYWLRKAACENAEGRSAYDVLVAALAGPLSGSQRLSALFARELGQDVQRAIGEDCRRVIDRDLLAAWNFDFVAARWQAATQARRLDVILRDLNHWRERLLPDHNDLWFAFLAQALEHLRWAAEGPTEDAFDPLRRELDELPVAPDSVGNAFERLDFMEQLWYGWNGLRFGLLDLGRWADLIPASWCGSPRHLRQVAEPLLKFVGEDPQVALRLFDDLMEHNSATIVQFRYAFRRYLYESAPWLDERLEQVNENLQAAATRCLSARSMSNYAAARGDLLMFCLDYCVTPSFVAWVAAKAWPNDPDGAEVFRQTLNSDLPLHTVWLGHRLYWQ